MILRNGEYREIQRMARSQGVSPADWVRQLLERTCRREPHADVGKKLQVIREATRHEYPATDMDHMLEEIERVYGSRAQP